MVLTLYQFSFSPPCRATTMLCRILELEINVCSTDLLQGEHLQPPFMKINPFHCIPTLTDDDFTLWESRAIMTYLVDKYSPGNDLYPTDIKTRATIDRWLFWDAGTFHASLAAYYGPVLRKRVKPFPPSAEIFLEKLKVLDGYLGTTKYICGDKPTLADISIMVTATTADASDLDITSYANIDRWLKQLEIDFPDWWKEYVIIPIEEFRALFVSRFVE